MSLKIAAEPVDLSYYPYRKESKKSDPKRAFHVLASEAGETGVLSNVAKIARGIISILEKVKISCKAAGQFASQLGFLVDSFKVLGGFKNIRDLADQAASRPKDEKEKSQRNFKIAANVTGLAVAGLTVTKILDSLKILELSKWTEAIGKVPILGKAAPVLALDPVTNVVQIVLATLSIAIAANTIEKLDQKSDAFNEKRRNWKALDLDKIKDAKIAHIQKKMGKIQEDAEKLGAPESQGKIEKSKAIYEAKSKVYEGKKLENLLKRNCVARAFGKISLFFKQFGVKIAEQRYLRIARKHNALCAKGKAHEEKYAKLEKNLGIWSHIESVPKEELEKLKREKLNQLKVKQVNLSFEKAKEGLGIAFNVVLIAALVTAIVFTALSIGAVPAALTLTSIFLFVSVFSLGLHLFKKYHKPTSVPKVALPTPAVTAAP